MPPLSRPRARATALLVLPLLATPLLAATVPLRDWAIPSSATGVGPAPLADAGYPGVFVPFSPCRLVDTRDAAGPYGGPKLGTNGSRDFDLNGHPTCTGIPFGVAAYSLNFTVTETGGPGYLTVYPTGGTFPLASTVNYTAGQTIANAAIVPAAASGSITVFAGVSGTHVVVDVNGYFMDYVGTLNAGEYLGLTGTRDAGGLLYVANLSTSSSTTTSSIRAYYGSTVAGQAVYGDSGGATGLVHGVRGVVDSVTDGAAGVKGVATAATGVVYGVHGTAVSNRGCAAGVYGELGEPLPCSDGSNLGAGVFGAVGSQTGFRGVLGRAAGFANSRGVEGNQYHLDGYALSSGVLGYGTVGVHSFSDITAAGTKSFVEPHPTDPARQIVYVALEGPEAGTYFRGRGRFAGGKALIRVPDDFRLVTSADGLTCQLTPIGKAVAVGVTRLSLEGIEVEATADVEFSYLVQGVRRHYEGFRPVQENVLFVPAGEEARMDPWPPHVKQRLVDVGIYNADGTPNLDTARRLGWKSAWDEAKAREEAYQRQVQEARAKEKAADTQSRR